MSVGRVPLGSVPTDGVRVAGVGDLDGDGFDDVAACGTIVAWDSPGVSVYLGGANGPVAAPAGTWRVGSCQMDGGDLDGDGFAELVRDRHPTPPRISPWPPCSAAARAAPPGRTPCGSPRQASPGPNARAWRPT